MSPVSPSVSPRNPPLVPNCKPRARLGVREFLTKYDAQGRSTYDNSTGRIVINRFDSDLAAPPFAFDEFNVRDADSALLYSKRSGIETKVTRDTGTKLITSVGANGIICQRIVDESGRLIGVNYFRSDKSQQ